MKARTLLLSNVFIDTEHSEPCPLRDLAEPVFFTINARVVVKISRFADTPGADVNLLEKIVIQSLAREGIEIL